MRAAVTISFLCLFASSVWGANLTLVADSPFLLDKGTTDGFLLIDVVSDDPAPPATENLSGWQFLLAIVPDAGAMGTVEFSVPILPPDYILNGVNFGLSTLISTDLNPNDRLFAFDFEFPSVGGQPVPTAPGAGLLELAFTASADAMGTFGVFAVPGLGNTEWTDSSGLGGAAREYANIPTGGGNVRIAEVQIVPEPSALLLVCCGVVAVRRVRRRSSA